MYRIVALSVPQMPRGMNFAGCATDTSTCIDRSTLMRYPPAFSVSMVVERNRREIAQGAEMIPTECKIRVRGMHLSTIALVLHLAAVVSMPAQRWHPTPDRITLKCYSMATPDDSTIICANQEGVLRIDLSRNPQLGSHIYESEGSIIGLWADGSVILVVDGSDKFLDNRLMRSTDNGRSWVKIDVSEFDVQPVTIRSDQSGHLYLGCTFATVLVSEDEGRTWSLLERFSPLSANQHMVPNSIDIHPQGSVVSIVDIALKEAAGANSWYRQLESGSWTDISIRENVGTIDEWEIVRLDQSRLAGLEVDRQGRFTLHFSSDNGETWTVAEGVTPVYMFPYPGPYLYVDRDSTWLYVCLAIGSNSDVGPVHISRDYGATFDRIGGERRVYSFSRGRDGRIWAVFWDYGQHWLWRENEERTQLRPVLGSSNLGVAYSMTDRPIKALTASLYVRGGVWFALVEGDGVWSTTNSGRSWAKLANSLWDEASSLASGRDGSVYLGSDLGVVRMSRYDMESWEPLTFDVGVRKIGVVSDAGVVAETLDDVLVRIDPDGTIRTISPDSTRPVRLLSVDRYDRVVAADSSGLYLLSNFSTRWSSIGDSSLSRKALSFCSIDENHFMVGTDDGAFLSTDGGESWGASGLMGRRIDRLLISSALIPLYPISTIIPRIVAQTGDTLWSSVDTGATWVDISDTLPEGAITAITADNEGSLVAAIYGYGVYWQDYPWILSVQSVVPHTPSVSVVTRVNGTVQVLIEQSSIGGENVSLTMMDLHGRAVEGEAVTLRDRAGTVSIVWTPTSAAPRVLLGRVSFDDCSYSFKTILHK